MSTEATLMTGDTGRVLGATLRYADGEPIDLTGATVVFIFKPQADTYALFARACMVTSPTTGEVTFDDWTAGDIDTPGTYDAQFRVTASSGVVHCPSDHYLRIRIRQSLEVDPTP